MYVLTYFSDCIRLVIFSWKKSGDPEIPIGRRMYEYLPQGNTRSQPVDPQLKAHFFHPQIIHSDHLLI